MSEEKNRPGRPLLSDIKAPWPELFHHEHGQVKLAEKLGVSQSTVGKWARGMHRIPALARRELLALCKEHGIKDGIKRFVDA